jgi:hypothetical protein
MSLRNLDLYYNSGGSLLQCFFYSKYYFHGMHLHLRKLTALVFVCWCCFIGLDVTIDIQSIKQR